MDSKEQSEVIGYYNPETRMIIIDGKPNKREIKQGFKPLTLYALQRMYALHVKVKKHGLKIIK